MTDRERLVSFLAPGLSHKPAHQYDESDQPTDLDQPLRTHPSGAETIRFLVLDKRDSGDSDAEEPFAADKARAKQYATVASFDKFYQVL